MTRRGPRSPVTAAALSLLFPGLGQYAAGARRRGVLIATPALRRADSPRRLRHRYGVGRWARGLLGLVLRPEVLVDGRWPRPRRPRLPRVLDPRRLAHRAARRHGRRSSTGLIAIVGLLAVLVLATLGYGSVAALGVETERHAHGRVPGRRPGRPPPATGRSRSRASARTMPAASTPPRRARHRRRRPTHRATSSPWPRA